MTLSLFLRLYGACVILTLLLTQLGFPFAPLRRWLSRAPEAVTDPHGRVWQIRVEGQTVTQPQSSKRDAYAQAEIGWVPRVRGWVRDLTECPWCASAWVSGGALFGYWIGWGSIDVVLWYGFLWLATAATIVVLDRIAEG